MKTDNPTVQFVTISADEAGQRIDNFLHTRLKGVPKSMVYRILRKGEVRVNKKRVKPEYKLLGGDEIRIPRSDRPNATTRPFRPAWGKSPPWPIASSMKMTTCWCSTSLPAPRYTAAAG